MPTLKDIAKASGCSFQAVSAILRDQPGARFRPETRALVLQTASALGYRPNSSAVAMRSGSTGCVALLKGTHPNHNTLSAPVLGGITAELDRHDLHLAILTLGDAQLTSAVQLPKVLRQAMADGVLIKIDAGIPPQLPELLAHFAIPAIWVNSKQSADCVRPDDRAAGRMATERLLELGHRRIAYADFSNDLSDRDTGHYSCHDRHAGYGAAMRTAGLTPQLLGGRCSMPDRVDRLEVAVQQLRHADRPTAVIGQSAWSALPLWHAALRLGLRVPDDISLLCFENGPQDQFGQELSQYRVPESEMGCVSARLLMEKLAEPSLVHPARLLPFTWMPGQTVAPPSAALR